MGDGRWAMGGWGMATIGSRSRPGRSAPGDRPSSIVHRPSSGQPYGELVRQYLELRDEHPGIVLLFRVGSFYEVLFDDAELVARELGLKLGERPSGGSAPPVPQDRKSVV